MINAEAAKQSITYIKRANNILARFEAHNLTMDSDITVDDLRGVAKACVQDFYRLLSEVNAFMASLQNNRMKVPYSNELGVVIERIYKIVKNLF